MEAYMLDLIMSRVAYWLAGFFFMLTGVLFVYRDWLCGLLVLLFCSIMLAGAIIEDIRELEYRKSFFELNSSKNWIKRCG